MQFGNYKIDSFYLIMIIGFSYFFIFPFMLLSVLVLLIIGLEKVDKED